MAKKKETEATTQTQEQEAQATVQEPEAPAVNYADIIRGSLLKTERAGMADLLDFMEEIGFLEAPCSGGNHLAKKGGLAEHSVNVLNAAEKMSVALIGGKNITKEIRDSITIAALLHDLGKCGDYDKPMYVENILKSGQQSEAKPFKRNKDLSGVPHAIRSVKLATLFIDLTEDEEWAILCHDGLYDFMKYEMQGKETWLSMLIHWADMWASRVIEGGSNDEE